MKGMLVNIIIMMVMNIWFLMCVVESMFLLFLLVFFVWVLSYFCMMIVMKGSVNILLDISIV